MSTPVSVDSPPVARLRTGSEQERDLQAKIQHLIALQYQEQTQHQYDEEYDPSYGNTPNAAPNRKNFVSGSNSRRQHSLSTLGQQPHGQQGLRESSSSGIDGGYWDEVVRAPHSSSRDSLNPQAFRQSGVGQGTIVFSDTLRDLTGCTSSSSPTKEYLPQQHERAQKLQQHMPPQLPSSGPTQRGSSFKPPRTSPSHGNRLPQQIYAGYGSVQEQDSQPQELHNQQIQQHQQHEFHYSNPDCNQYTENHDNKESADLLCDEHDEDENHRRRRRSDDCWLAKICCLYRPIVQLFRRESLHRSYCYGAIDGLLTGSAIVSAFWGLGVLTVRTAWEVRLAIVALAMAACVADSLCMALGHVWTTYVVTYNNVAERCRERRLLENNKAESKGRLVDMLLARGVLKIDAMSLADTLEGYPDLLVSALIGDSLLAGPEEGGDDERTEDGYNSLRGYHLDTSASSLQQQGQPMGAGLIGSLSSWKFAAYGQFDSGQFEMESYHTQAMLQESQIEGLFMMVGFSTFAILPSLLWLFLPLFFQDSSPSSVELSHSKSSSSAPSSNSSPMVELPSLIVFILSLIVWCLGVWKSCFVDSNWVMFGTETVAVLVVCVFSAYCVAMLMVWCFGLATGNGDKLLPDSLGHRDL